MDQYFEIDIEFVKSYLQSLKRDDREYEEYGFYVIDLDLDHRWDDLWKLLKLVAELECDIESSILATIAAGPLEDLLNGAGLQFIDRIMALAKSNRRFAKMLTGVWRSDIEPEVWAVVVDFCRKYDDPIDVTYQF